MAFRVTNQMMSQRMLENLWASMRRLDKWNQQLSTGRRISLPSDDPADTETAMRLRTLLREGEQYVRNVDDALAWLEATDAALNHATQVLQRARELIIYGGNGTLTDEARQALATEMNQLIHDLFAVANTKHGQRYLFAGENTLIRPFEAILEEPDDPSSPVGNFQYHGTRYEPADGFDGLELEIEAGNTLRYNIFGNDVFEPIFDVLIAVREHLENGNLNDLTGDDLRKFDEAMDNLLRWRAEVGARVNRLELVRERLSQNQVNLEKLSAEVEGIDIAEVIMRLKMEENVYRAALGAGARIIQPTLLDFLT
ncbi:MAG: hypothetical protein CW345_07725 [Firmicutes bacterium]|nr:hypothetical protein [Bacillota bacterium]